MKAFEVTTYDFYFEDIFIPKVTDSIRVSYYHTTRDIAGWPTIYGGFLSGKFNFLIDDFEFFSIFPS
jgi:hypothetical protein